MQATKILMDEHLVIQRVLTALESATERIGQGEQMRAVFFLNVALFNKNFTDGCHHHKEEGVFFVAMEEAGIPTQGGPINVMLAEHEQGRLFTRELKYAAEFWERGDLSAKTAVIQNGLGYIALLRQHIQKEDKILFPMAERLIPPDPQRKVDADFALIRQEESDSGIYEKYLALAEVIEKESQKHI